MDLKVILDKTINIAPLNKAIDKVKVYKGYKNNEEI
jgi:hypothetical protein